MSGKATTTVFTTNKTQAVRLPKAVAFPDDVGEVEIIAIGSSRVISPIGHRWDTFFNRNSKISEDFLAEREQPANEERDEL
jgi:antitoxin VapB